MAEEAVRGVNRCQLQKNGELVFKFSTYQEKIKEVPVEQEAEEATNCLELCKVHPSTSKRPVTKSCLNLLNNDAESSCLGTSWYHKFLNLSDRSSNGKDCTPTVSSQEEKDLSSRHFSPIPQIQCSLGFDVKEEDSMAAFCQPFTDAQQCQLRIQILVYGALIDCTFPSQSLMGVAFADISNETRIESWEISMRRSEEKWENIWKKSAQKIQRTVFATGGLSVAGISHRSSILHTRNKSKIPPPFSLEKTSPLTVSSIGTRLFDAFMLDKIADMVSTSMIQFSKRPHPADIRIQASSIGFAQKLYASLRWGSSSGTLPARHRFQEVAPNWKMRSANHPFSLQGTSSSWFFPSASGLDMYPCARVVPLFSEAISTEKELPASLKGCAVCQHPPLSPASLPVLHSYSLKAAAKNVAGKGIHVLGNGKTGVRRLRNVEPQWKRKKTARLFEATKESPAHPASSKPSILTDLSERSVLSSQRSVSNCPRPSTSARICAQDKIPVNCKSRLRTICSSKEFLAPISKVAPISTHVCANGQFFPQTGTIAEGPALQGSNTRLEEAKLNAHESLSMAVLAVQHSKLTHRPRRGCHSKGLQLACSAAAVSAAVSVAKAAAAAAKLAYETAVEANLMLSSRKEENSVSAVEPGSSIPSSEDGWIVGNVGWIPPEHWQILRSCKSAISLAKARSRKQIESVSAAKRRAQNVEVLVQAAELAVGAAEQAGALMPIGKPALPTPKILQKIGLGTIWRMQKSSSPRIATSKALSSHINMNLGKIFLSHNNAKISGKKRKGVDKTRRNQKTKPPNRDSQILHTKGQKGNGTRGCKILCAKKLKRFSVSRREQLCSLSGGASAAMLLFMERMQVALSSQNEIVKGSVVEVVPYEEGFQGVWFSAKVLSIEGNQALVVYDELLSDDGNSQLKEWVPLLCPKKRDLPRVRPAHPMIKDESSRRQRRSALGNQMWRVGDHVDAWMRDGWWEGIVISVNDEYDSKVTVFFPGDGDMHVMKSWNLRPSLLWRDGRWTTYEELPLSSSEEVCPSSSTGPNKFKERSVISKQAIAPWSSQLSKKRRKPMTKLNAMNKLNTIVSETPRSPPLSPNHPCPETEIAQEDIEKDSEIAFAKMHQEPTWDTKLNLGTIGPPFQSQKRPTPEGRKRKYQKIIPRKNRHMEIDGKQPFAEVTSIELDDGRTRGSGAHDSLFDTSNQVQMSTINANEPQYRSSRMLMVRRKRNIIIKSA